MQCSVKCTNYAIVMAIAQHCPKLEKLELPVHSPLTYKCLIALSERGLPLIELDILDIPNIPTADIARRCSHALSCIPRLNTRYYQNNIEEFSVILPYMTGLTSVFLGGSNPSYLPLLTQYCHKLTKIEVYSDNYSIQDILSLCHANPLLQELLNYKGWGLTDTTLIELIHACPHLHTLQLPHTVAVTDIGILALSEHCPQLQHLDIGHCTQVTDTAVLALSKRCRRLTYLNIGSCTDITDSSVLALSERCHNMETLCIQSSKYVTEAAVGAVLQRCARLRVLRFSDRNCQIGSVHRLQQQYLGRVVAEHHKYHTGTSLVWSVCVHC